MRHSIHPSVPRLRRSEGIGESMSQPFRAGLTFGSGPTGLFQFCDLFSRSRSVAWSREKKPYLSGY